MSPLEYRRYQQGGSDHREYEDENVGRLRPFSVDPTVDTPDKIQAFMADYDLAKADWQFLTGYSQEEIEAFAQQNFKALVRKPSEGTQVDHATWFYLVDQDGKIIKAYQGFQDVPIEDIVNDIKILQNS